MTRLRAAPILALSFACASSPVAPSTPATQATLAKEVAAPPAGGWDCSGRPLPAQGSYEAELGFGASPEVAAAAARTRLTGRLCSGIANCASLEREMTLWKWGTSGAESCAMVLIASEAVAKFREGATASALDASLAAAAGELVEGRRGLRLALDKIVDDGVPGGRRADWLSLRLTRAFSSVGAVVTELPRGWDGAKLPEGIALVVEGSAVSRNEKLEKIIELQLRGRYAAGGALASRVAQAVSFPAAVAPSGGASLPVPQRIDGLSLRLESRPGGSLCPGDRTQLHLRSDRVRFVRVFDLYGEGEALLLYPGADNPTGRIEAGQTLALGGAGGFEALPVPGAELERYLVVAAEAPAQLEALERLRGVCRVGSELARRLHRLERLPARARIATDGFRLAASESCPSFDESRRAALVAELVRLLECP